MELKETDLTGENIKTILGMVQSLAKKFHKENGMNQSFANMKAYEYILETGLLRGTDGMNASQLQSWVMREMANMKKHKTPESVEKLSLSRERIVASDVIFGGIENSKSPVDYLTPSLKSLKHGETIIVICDNEKERVNIQTLLGGVARKLNWGISSYISRSVNANYHGESKPSLAIMRK